MDIDALQNSITHLSEFLQTLEDTDTTVTDDDQYHIDEMMELCTEFVTTFEDKI